MTETMLTLAIRLNNEGIKYSTPSNGDCSIVINKHKVNLRKAALKKTNKTELAYRCILREKGQKVEFYILCIKNDFYVLPAKDFPRQSICINPNNLKRYYREYKNNWKLLK